ncbi:aromatic ring-hydroxylating oxygenase subunit alpha [Xenophilus azovorans]|uniref:aromatic ring-hydroxylating oxygenase subunit alpha n=1 Tax=Xenophilus azovorans TaxID=151755 RepID=UPI0005707557|nr:aromatic ring-hydroxylating dioxygenase subunit alpha [Xenophilus azovorans]
MDPATASAILARALRSLAAGRPEMAAHDAEIPVRHYLDADRFARELRTLRRHPVPIAAAADLAQAGDHVAAHRLGAPLLAVRGDDGVLRAFLNVCRHRGAQVVPDGQGRGARRFACPYHAWTYGSDGTLRGLPQRDGFPGLDMGAAGLRPLAVAEAAGVVWVLPDPDCAGHDLRAQLGPLAAELDAMGFGMHVPFAPRRLELRCNWKLLVDGAFEAYHFKTAHRDTIASMFADNQQVIDEFGPNRRLYLVKAGLDTRTAPAPADFRPREHGNLIYFFFPGTAILVQGDHAQLSHWEPIAPDRTAVHELTLLPEAPAGDKALRHWERNVALYRRTLAEDYALAESIQAGLASGANEALRFGRFEFAAPRFHAQLEALCTAGAPSGAR